MLLLELKDFLENLTTRIPAVEILTFTKFLLLTFVILPVVPNKDYGPFAVNPFKSWLIVVAISGVSYGSYLLEKLAKGKGGVRLSALLGGLYSSTFTTVVMAKESKTAGAPHSYAGGILIASGVMYFRFLVLIGIFNRELMNRLVIPFVDFGGAGHCRRMAVVRHPRRRREGDEQRGHRRRIRWSWVPRSCSGWCLS